MKYFIIALCLFLAGCTTAPITSKFPEAPAILLEKCKELKPLQEDAKLSDVAKTVTLNYTSYYDCSIKNDSWIEWYTKNKKIYEDLK